jgi:hypothetical protein
MNRFHADFAKAFGDPSSSNYQLLETLLSVKTKATFLLIL